MMKLGQYLVVVTTLTLIFALPITPLYISAQATTPLTVRVFAPSAHYQETFQNTNGWPGNANYLDQNLIGITADVSYIVTANFHNPWYSDYWAPYTNRSTFPPDDATIVSISMVAIARSTTGSRPFTLHASYTDATTATTTTVHAPQFWTTPTTFIHGNPLYHTTLFTFNMTASFATVFSHWNATMLTNNTSELKISVTPDTGGTNIIYFDYIGLDYTWTSSLPGAQVPFSGKALGIPSAMGIFGIIGFAGMIALPAAGIWMARRSDEPRMLFGLKLMLAFVVCLGLFLASIA